jgi:hypothetical protein
VFWISVSKLGRIENAGDMIAVSSALQLDRICLGGKSLRNLGVPKSVNVVP